MRGRKEGHKGTEKEIKGEITGRTNERNGKGILRMEGWR
jgi:hypothetical protein